MEFEYELEYKNGRRISKLLHEMTPLEASIHQYEEQVKKYYSKRNAIKTTLTDQQRKELKKEVREFLKKERANLKTIATVQGRLEEYRAQGMMVKSSDEKFARSTMNAMISEDHHPTDELEENMRAEGCAKPSHKHTAHHIVPGKGKLPVLTSQTRLHIHMQGIRINDPANGVYLVHVNADVPDYGYCMPESKGHLCYHTHDYERWISLKITQLENIDEIKTQLQIIGRLIQDNEPKVAIPKIGKRQGMNK